MKAFLFLSLVWGVLTGSHAATGPIVIDSEYPHSFRYDSGERFFPMGDTAYFLIAQPTNIIAHYIDVRCKHHFNFVRVMAMADGFWPFGGTPTHPDFTTINEVAMCKWDWVFEYASSRGMNFELILWGYGIGGGEGLWARESDQDFWIKTVVNRFKNRENLFMFTIANEFERYRDGDYRFDASDADWAQKVASRIRELDPTQPIGCHPSVWITDQDSPNGPRPFNRYNGFTQRLPQVVWPLWEGSAINLNITQNNEGIQPRTWGDLAAGERGLTYYPTNWQGVDYGAEWSNNSGWKFEAPGLQNSLAEDWAHGKPVLNTEFGYQSEPGYEIGQAYKTRQAHDPSTVRKKAWKIATSGAFFAAGFESAAVRNFTVADIDNFRPAQLETLYNFFTTKTEYWKMAPHHESVASHNSLLALEGKEYIAYFPRGGTNHIKIVKGVYRVEWLHPESDKYFPQGSVSITNQSANFSPPMQPNDDWVLHLKN